MVLDKTRGGGGVDTHLPLVSFEVGLSIPTTLGINQFGLYCLVCKPQVSRRERWVIYLVVLGFWASLQFNPIYTLLPYTPQGATLGNRIRWVSGSIISQNTVHPSRENVLFVPGCSAFSALDAGQLDPGPSSTESLMAMATAISSESVDAGGTSLLNQLSEGATSSPIFGTSYGTWIDWTTCIFG